MEEPTTPILPEDFALRMKADLGPQAAPLLGALQEPPEVSVRLNPRKPSDIAEMRGAERVAWCPTGYYLPDRPHFAAMPEWHAGALYVQDASSMIHRHIAAAIFDMLPTQAPLVLDACAAPGGKTTAMADVLPPDALLIANECMPQRAAILRENIARWGQHQVLAASAPTSAFASLGPTFHMIAVDAPCSGEGMMRKEPEAVRQWSPALVEKCARLQRDILRDAVEALLPGGYLIYSTCTFNTEEDEGNTLFLTEELGMEPVGIPIPAEWGIGRAVRPDVEALRFMPHLTRGEGLYVSVVRKAGELPFHSDSGKSRGRKQRPAPEAAAALPLLDASRQWDIIPLESTIYARAARHAGAIDAIAAKVRRMQVGLRVATVKGRDVIPSPELALSDALNQAAFPRVELSADDARTYLRREPLTLPADTPRGIVLASHNGLPLGWSKHLGNRTNNLYPAEWRLRTH